jgi:hypothetical protein
MTAEKLHQGFRISPQIHAELQAIAAELTRRAAGVSLGIPTAIRLCVERGIPVMRSELGLKSKVHPSVRPKARKP